MHGPQRQIPPHRRTIYYIGLAPTVLGALLFGSVFVSFALHFGDFTDFDARGRSMALRAFGGMAFMIIGSILMAVGARGLAGTGLVLDPEQAREDVEPWSGMDGGVVHDARSGYPESSAPGSRDPLRDVVAGVQRPPAAAAPQPPPLPQVKLRCRGCQALNDETARFCNQCGATL